MSFSEDLPAEPASGGNVSDIFEVPDVVWHSPTTTERIVDTQSGFQVVIKQLDNRNSLYVKRRIGTPPSNSVQLTPDESLKLSKILNGAASVDETAKSFSPSAEVFLSEFDQGTGDVKFRSIDSTANKLKNFLTINTVSILLVGVLLGFIVQNFVYGHQLKPKEANVSSQDQVESFARNFVAELLDFSPSSYRISQIRAMGNMTPDLVDSYWKDTNFPLNKNQLISLSQYNTLNIINLKQRKIDNKTTDIEITARLIDNKNHKSNPVHLQLKIEQDAHKQLHVTALKDLTNPQ